MDERSDLDEQRTQWAWTKVSGATNKGRRMIDCWAAGLPSTQEKPRRDKCVQPFGNAGDDLTCSPRRPVCII